MWTESWEHSIDDKIKIMIILKHSKLQRKNIYLARCFINNLLFLVRITLIKWTWIRKINCFLTKIICWIAFKLILNLKQQTAHTLTHVRTNTIISSAWSCGQQSGPFRAFYTTLQIDCKLRMKISKYLIWLCPNKDYGQVSLTNSNKENSSFPSFYHHCNANNFFQNWFSSHAQIESCVYTNIKLGRKYFPAQNANAGRRAKVLPSYHSHTRKWALIQFGRFIQTTTTVQRLKQIIKTNKRKMEK